MTTDMAVDLSRLPTTLRRLIRSIGLPATLHLLTARGGTRWYLGGVRGRRDRKLLVSIIGQTAAEAFYAEFGGEAGRTEVTLPKADKILIQYRDAQIRADQTRSLAELAVMYRLTSRHIQNIRRGAEPEEPVENRQIDLFSAAAHCAGGARAP
jgi:hypothetical protein